MSGYPKAIREAERVVKESGLEYRIEHGVRHYHIWSGKHLLCTLSANQRKDTKKVRSAVRREVERLLTLLA